VRWERKSPLTKAARKTLMILRMGKSDSARLLLLLERGDEGSGGHVPLWVVDLIEVEGDSLREVAQGFVDCVAFAGHIHLKTLRYLPVLFPVYCG
jgi:hypothetical protein